MKTAFIFLSLIIYIQKNKTIIEYKELICEINLIDFEEIKNFMAYKKENNSNNNNYETVVIKENIKKILKIKFLQLKMKKEILIFPKLLKKKITNFLNNNETIENEVNNNKTFEYINKINEPSIYRRFR